MGSPLQGSQGPLHLCLTCPNTVAQGVAGARAVISPFPTTQWPQVHGSVLIWAKRHLCLFFNFCTYTEGKIHMLMGFQKVPVVASVRQQFFFFYNFCLTARDAGLGETPLRTLNVSVSAAKQDILPDGPERECSQMVQKDPGGVEAQIPEPPRRRCAVTGPQPLPSLPGHVPQRGSPRSGTLPDHLPAISTGTQTADPCSIFI